MVCFDNFSTLPLSFEEKGWKSLPWRNLAGLIYYLSPCHRVRSSSHNGTTLTQLLAQVHVAPCQQIGLRKGDRMQLIPVPLDLDPISPSPTSFCTSSSPPLFLSPAAWYGTHSIWCVLLHMLVHMGQHMYSCQHVQLLCQCKVLWDTLATVSTSSTQAHAHCVHKPMRRVPHSHPQSFSSNAANLFCIAYYFLASFQTFF